MLVSILLKYQIGIEDFLNYLKSKYNEHTTKCYLSYFERYGSRIF